jgi:hypothetical protein
MEALLRLARVGNVDLNWLLTGEGEIRPAGLLPGAALADVLMADQYELGTSLLIPTIINQIPFSRYVLENKLGLKGPTHDTLLVVEAAWDLYPIRRGHLVLIDQNQAVNEAIQRLPADAAQDLHGWRTIAFVPRHLESVSQTSLEHAQVKQAWEQIRRRRPGCCLNCCGSRTKRKKKMR